MTLRTSTQSNISRSEKYPGGIPSTDKDKYRIEEISENLHIGKVALDTIIDCNGDCADRLRKALGATN